MAGKKGCEEVVHNLRELETRITLRRIRAKGHLYVELRKDGKRYIFFCVLCRVLCYSDVSLFDHLKGKLHRGRFEGAKLTLIGPDPWPFNDGFFFYYEPSAHDLAVSGPLPDNLLTYKNNGGGNANGNALSIVSHEESSKGDVDSIVALDSVGHKKNGECGECVVRACDKNLNVALESYDLVIQGMLWKEEYSSLGVKLVGLGRIGAKIDDNYGIDDEMLTIWCEWLGKRGPEDEDVFMIPEYNFGIVVFSCDVDLGRNVPGIRSPSPLYTPCSDDEGYFKGKKNNKLKSFSDPEDISSTLTKRGGSYGASSLQDRCDDVQIPRKRTKSRKATKKRMKRQKQLERIVEKRVCEICQHKLLPGKDVACLLNMKTRRLVCTSRNKTGAFHIFHTSCLVHWILLCESEIWKNQPLLIEMDGEVMKPIPKVSSAFCPQCQGTGSVTEEDQLEIPRFLPQSEIFEHKITLSGTTKEWMRNPEILQNRSIGLRFNSEPGEPIQEKVSLAKLLRFYRADEQVSSFIQHEYQY